MAQRWEGIEATPPQHQALKPTASDFRIILEQKQAKDRIGTVPTLIADGSFPAKNIVLSFGWLQAVSEAKVIFTGQPIISELMKISILTVSAAQERGERGLLPAIW